MKTKRMRWFVLLPGVTTAFVLLVLYVLGLLYPLRSGPGDYFLSRCSFNMISISWVLEKYAADHSGRLPAPPAGSKSDAYAWAPFVEPYLRGHLYVLRCPADHRPGKQTSYRMDPHLYGKLWSEVRKKGSVPLLVEDGARHYGKRHVLLCDGTVAERP